MKRLLSVLLCFAALLFVCSCEAQPQPTNTPAVTSMSTDLPSENDLKVHFINVGQGDSSFIEFPDGSTMLIDAGEREYGSVVLSYIRSLGYDHIDYLVATHPHSDHIGGMHEVVEGTNIGAVYMPRAQSNTATFEKLLTAIKSKGLKIGQAKAGVSIKKTDNVSVDILSPVSDQYDNLNNWSAVIMITYGKTKYLFMGDAEREVEKQLYDCRADVVKVGHHGSSTSSSPDFIARTDAKYAVVSVGEGNSYGHPHKETLTAWQNAGATVLRTDQLGTIVIGSNGTLVTALGGGGVISSDAVTSSKDEPDNQSSKAQYKYVLNISSKKIHLPSCSAVTDMNAENRQYTSKTLNELLAEGYSACGNCKPS